jgi:Peptidase family C25
MTNLLRLNRRPWSPILILIVAFTFSAVAQSNLISVFKTPSVSCDYLIVCPHQFLASAQRLAAFRNNFTGDDVAFAKVVELATLDTEFPTGDTIPRCGEIWYAVNYALQQWTVKPKYLVLMGDDSVAITGFDSLSFPKSAGLMPTCYQYADTSTFSAKLDTSVAYGDFLYCTAYDSSFLEKLRGNYRFGLDLAKIMPVISVGRIPARSAAECSVYVDKVIAFENRNGARPWYNNAILCADDRMQGLNLDPLGAMHLESCETISDNTLMGFFQNKVYLSSFPKSPAGTHDNARSAYFADVNKGARWCIYFGHGSPDSLTDERFLTTGDASLFTNDTTPTMFFAFTCSNADFLRRPSQQMCRAFLFKPTGGCISYFGATQEVYASDNEKLAANLFYQASGTEHLSLGQAVSAAFAQSRDDNMTWYQILGDPALTFLKKKAALSPAIAMDANGLFTFTPNSAVNNGQLQYQCEISCPATVTCIDTAAGSPLQYQSDSVLASKEGSLNGPVSAQTPADFHGDKVRFTLYASNADLEARFDTVVTLFAGVRGNPHAAIAAAPSLRFSRGIVTVSCAAGAKGESPHLSIYNLQGRLCAGVTMHSRNGDAYFDFNEAHLAQGNYVLQATAGGQVFSQKVLFMR